MVKQVTDCACRYDKNARPDALLRTHVNYCSDFMPGAAQLSENHDLH
jgi:hypothetical protein